MVPPHAQQLQLPWNFPLQTAPSRSPKSGRVNLLPSQYLAIDAFTFSLFGVTKETSIQLTRVPQMPNKIEVGQGEADIGDRSLRPHILLGTWYLLKGPSSMGGRERGGEKEMFTTVSRT